MIGTGMAMQAGSPPRLLFQLFESLMMKHVQAGNANVALNLSSLGAHVTCAGLVGLDLDAELLEQMLTNYNVRPLLTRVDHRTITKLRVLSHVIK